MKTVIGLFDSVNEANAARNALVGSGIEQGRISVVTRPKSATGRPEKTEAAESAGIGATAGAVAGGAAGLLASLGALAIPGIGPLLAAGAIVTTLTAAGVGAGVGGVIGALIGLGIPDHEAELYEEGIKRGGTLLTVDATDNDADRIAAVLSRHNAVDIDKRSAEWQSTGWQPQRAPHGATLARRNPPETSAGTDPQTQAKNLEVLRSGNIGGPEATPGPRGVDRADVSNSGASIGSVGVGMGEGIGDTAGTRRSAARIYNPP